MLPKIEDAPSTGLFKINNDTLLKNYTFFPIGRLTCVVGNPSEQENFFNKVEMQSGTFSRPSHFYMESRTPPLFSKRVSNYFCRCFEKAPIWENLSQNEKRFILILDLLDENRFHKLIPYYESWFSKKQIYQLFSFLFAILKENPRRFIIIGTQSPIVISYVDQKLPMPGIFDSDDIPPLLEYQHYHSGDGEHEGYYAPENWEKFYNINSGKFFYEEFSSDELGFGVTTVFKDNLESFY